MSDLQSLRAASSSPSALVADIHAALQGDHAIYRFGTFSPSVYDTAWVSMVYKEEYGQVRWLFPDAFQFVLQSQTTEGIWQSYASPVDGILNTLASLLALTTHHRADRYSGKDAPDFTYRIQKAHRGVQSLLKNWSVDDTVHVGFEILIPSLLSQLEKGGIHLEFPGRHRLYELYETKIKAFNPKVLYSGTRTTLLHSVEALVDLIDLGRISHHCNEDTGIFGSPAATAAFLMHAPTWSKAAETYLTIVVRHGIHGGVPSAFPTTLFETSWALSTLLSLDSKKLHGIESAVTQSLAAQFLQVMDNQTGVVGFAPGVLEDADDTARALLTLHYLGVQVDPTLMTQAFSAKGYFRTYQLEQKPSFSTNCNVLLALLCAADLENHWETVQDVVSYLLSSWATGAVADKWNISLCYSRMLLVDALSSLLTRINESCSQPLPVDLIERRLPVAICQILTQTLVLQKQDGSWRSSVEETAYSMLAIAKCMTLPWDSSLQNSMSDAYQKAACFLSTEAADCPDYDYLWIEKVTYGSRLLRKVYVAAAMNVATEQLEWTETIRKSFQPPKLYSTKIRPLFSRLPFFAKRTPNYIELAMIEAGHLFERLQTRRNNIFPRDEIPVTKDDYLLYIPVIWTVCNGKHAGALTPDCLWEMILLSMYNYQIDEYMESIIDRLPDSDIVQLLSHLESMRRLISSKYPKDQIEVIIPPFQSSADILVQLGGANSSVEPVNNVFDQYRAAQIISGYMTHIQQHPAVLCLSPQKQHDLANHLHDFLLSHICQNLNSRMADVSGRNGDALTSFRDTRLTVLQKRSGFFSWVRSLAANSTSCPISFRFFLALLGPLSQPIFQDAQSHFLASALASHLATMCRMYNDCGSATRDAEEGSLNSLDFVDFAYADSHQEERFSNGLPLAHPRKDEKQGEQLEKTTAAKKEHLLAIAQFERGCMELAFQSLSETVNNNNTMTAIRVLMDVTDLFGQIYVEKDIASRMKDAAHRTSPATG